LVGRREEQRSAISGRAQKLIGDELQLIQFGGMPRDTKPFRGVGSGVLEIAVRYDKDAYRRVVAVQLGKKLYVLQAFQKKSKTGHRDVEAGYRIDQAAVQRSKGACQP
jgi:phage-related protein